MLTFPAVYCVDSSPGPKYHIDAKVTRFGRDGTPAYSMLGRMKAESKSQFIQNFQKSVILRGWTTLFSWEQPLYLVMEKIIVGFSPGVQKHLLLTPLQI